MSENETELTNAAPDISMEERELGLASNPNLVWTPIKYKPEQLVQCCKSWKAKKNVFYGQPNNSVKTSRAV